MNGIFHPFPALDSYSLNEVLHMQNTALDLVETVAERNPL